MTDSTEDALANAAAEATKNDQDRSGASPSARLEHDKTFSTLAAQLALKGFAVYPLAAGGFFIAGHDLSKHAPDYKAVADFLQALESLPSQGKPRRKVE